MHFNKINSSIQRIENIIRHGSYIPTEYYADDINKVLFVPIPKVACTSIKLSMFGDSGDASAEINNHMEIHRYASQYGSFSIRREQLGYFKFAFVRNPFERLVSCFKDKVKRPVQHNGKYHFSTTYNNILIKTLFGTSFSSDMSFAEFVELVARIPDWISEGHFKSQHSILFSSKISSFDFIGKFETLENDWNKLVDRFGFMPLTHGNPTKRDALTEYYKSKRIIELVAKRYHADIEKFGYASQYNELVKTSDSDK